MSNGALVDRVVCLSVLSKDLEGELRLMKPAVRERCPELDCVTLETVHQLDLKVGRHDCDSEVSTLLDGTLHVGDLVHKFAGGLGTGRGVHEASFQLRSPALVATGTLRGVTNAGTHRAPAFNDCQRCGDVGVMEGLLIGTISRARDRRLNGCTLQAAYRLRFEPSEEGGSGPVAGTLEGAIICDCPGTAPTCVDLAGLAVGTTPGNPRFEQGVSFEVFNLGGVLAPDTEIQTRAPFTGLNVGHETRVRLPVSCSAIEAKLVDFAAPVRLEAFDVNGAILGTAVTSGNHAVEETLTINAPGIQLAIITAPLNEALLLRLCYTP